MQGVGTASSASHAANGTADGSEQAMVEPDCLMDVLSFNSHASGFKGKRFVVAVHVVPPFLMYDESKTGNDAFSGITADLLAELSKELIFEYLLVLADPERPETSMAPLDALQYKKKFPEIGNLPADMAGKFCLICASFCRFPSSWLAVRLALRRRCHQNRLQPISWTLTPLQRTREVHGVGFRVEDIRSRGLHIVC